jgi:hypothetical protein
MTAGSVVTVIGRPSGPRAPQRKITVVRQVGPMKLVTPKPQRISATTPKPLPGTGQGHLFAPRFASAQGHAGDVLGIVGADQGVANFDVDKALHAAYNSTKHGALHGTKHHDDEHLLATTRFAAREANEAVLKETKPGRERDEKKMFATLDAMHSTGYMPDADYAKWTAYYKTGKGSTLSSSALRRDRNSFIASFSADHKNLAKAKEHTAANPAWSHDALAKNYQGLTFRQAQTRLRRDYKVEGQKARSILKAAGFDPTSTIR